MVDKYLLVAVLDFPPLALLEGKFLGLNPGASIQRRNRQDQVLIQLVEVLQLLLALILHSLVILLFRIESPLFSLNLAFPLALDLLVELLILRHKLLRQLGLQLHVNVHLLPFELQRDVGASCAGHRGLLEGFVCHRFGLTLL